MEVIPSDAFTAFLEELKDARKRGREFSCDVQIKDDYAVKTSRYIFDEKVGCMLPRSHPVMDLIRKELARGNNVRLKSIVGCEGEGVTYWYGNTEVMYVPKAEEGAVLDHERRLAEAWLHEADGYLPMPKILDLVIPGDGAFSVVPNAYMCVLCNDRRMKDLRERLVLPRGTRAGFIPLRIETKDIRGLAMDEFGLRECQMAVFGMQRIFFAYEHYMKEDIAGRLYLLILCEKQRDGKMRITLPGGKRALGETSDECVKRELKEETGLDTEIVRNMKELALDEESYSLMYECELKLGLPLLPPKVEKAEEDENDDSSSEPDVDVEIEDPCQSSAK